MPRAAGLIRTSQRFGLSAFLAAWVCAAPAQSQDVTLTSRDGGVELNGSLISFDGEFYRIATDYGELTLDGTGVICAGPGCPDLSAYVADLAFAGPAITTGQLAPALIESFAQQEGYRFDRQNSASETLYRLYRDDDVLAARFRLRQMGDDEAFADLIANQTDFVLASRAALTTELDLARQADLGDLQAPGTFRVLALDALVPVVSPRNPISTISVEDLARIFAGEVESWAELGGVDQPVYLHVPAPGDAARSIFLERVMLPLGKGIDLDSSEHDDSAAMLDAIRRDPLAIGLVRKSQVDRVRILDLGGAYGFVLSAEDEALKSEDYPLPLPLFMYRGQGRLPRIAREFIRFAGSPAGQIAVLRSGFVDQSLTRATLSRQGDRLTNAIRNAGGDVTLSDLQEMTRTLQPLSRLSVSFRYDHDGARLDAQSVANIGMLADALETGTIGVRAIYFIGLTDTAGGADLNLRLSRERAQAVRDAVLAQALTFDPGSMRVDALGFGESMPLTCEDTEWGPRINRRVEVWLR